MIDFFPKLLESYGMQVTGSGIIHYEYCMIASIYIVTYLINLENI